MEHTLKTIKDDFPWTRIGKECPVEPFRKEGTGWFDNLSEGWADVCYEYLPKLDNILKKYDLMDYIYVAQVKEKFGGLKLYVDFLCFDNDENYVEFTKIQEKGINLFQKVVWNFEYATEQICCYCGTHENVKSYGGWVHFACPACEEKKIKEWQEAQAEWEKIRKKEQNESSMA